MSHREWIIYIMIEESTHGTGICTLTPLSLNGTGQLVILQPEIHGYFSGFADKHGFRDLFSCNHRVVGANWDDVSSQWKLRVEDPKKEVFERRCDFLIDGTGYLNSWRWLSISGLGSFNRRLLHTANWDGSFAVNWKAGRVDWEWVRLVVSCCSWLPVAEFARSSGIQLLPELQR